jgi:hypothetical protein
MGLFLFISNNLKCFMLNWWVGLFWWVFSRRAEETVLVACRPEYGVLALLIRR